MYYTSEKNLANMYIANNEKWMALPSTNFIAIVIVTQRKLVYYRDVTVVLQAVVISSMAM